MIEIMYMRIGRGGTLFLTALQSCSRTFYAFSRDHGFPDRGLLGTVSKSTGTPLVAVWFITVLSILPGLLELASPTATQAVFALTAVALDISYIVPIFCRQWFRNHPDVHFTPGPFYMPGLLGWAANCICIVYVIHDDFIHPAGTGQWDIDGRSLWRSFCPCRRYYLSRHRTSTTLRSSPPLS